MTWMRDTSNVDLPFKAKPCKMPDTKMEDMSQKLTGT